ncbi:protein of unknown function [Magnetospirillum sp. XM-1]|nr:protein of unknown function [Magnetospirillum sp. XM-1]
MPPVNSNVEKGDAGNVALGLINWQAMKLALLALVFICGCNSAYMKSEG